MHPALVSVLILIPVLIITAAADEQWVVSPGFGPSYISDTIPDRLLPGHSYPVLITFRNNGLVAWEDEMRRIGLLYEGDITRITAIPAFVEVPAEMNITPGKEAHFALTLLPVGLPGTYDLAFSVAMRSAVGDQKITETFTKKVAIVPTDGISSPVNGSIFIESPVPDMRVFLNTAEEGNVPVIVADVKPGKYEIRVSNHSFERIFPVEVERGVMTRLLVQGDESPPVITKKTVGPISDGTLIGYIEANIPLILIILLIIVICGGIGMHGLRKRKSIEDNQDEDEDKKKESDDPEKERLKAEKVLLDKVHGKKPMFEGMNPASDPAGSEKVQAVSIKGQGGSGKKGHISRPPEKEDSSKEHAGGDSKMGSPVSPPDVDIRVRDLKTKPGSATALIGVSNHSEIPITVEDQDIGAGGFGILPVDLPEPVDDAPEVLLPLRILAGGSEFFKSISIHYNRGIALLTRGVVEKAYEYFRSLLHVDPGNIDTLLHQAEILVGWGLEEEAAAILKEVLILDPSLEEVQEALVKMRSAEAKRKETRESDTRPKVEGYPDELSDRYTPIRVLGNDPFATVILVMKNDTGDLRALKIPRKMDTIGSSLFTEISLLYQLRHPYVLRMFRAEFSPVVMLELEYVAGAFYEGKQRMSLSDLPVPLPKEVWFPLIEKIAEGLAYLHRQGVRHYHLSPRYILLDEPMVPKISGLIRESLRGAGGSGKEEFFVRAPEQIDSEFFGKPGKRTDIYQLGAIWFWLVSGQVLETEGQETETDGSRPYISRFDPSGEEYDPLILKLTARFKKDRYSSTEQFLTDLKGLDASQSDLSDPDASVD